MEGSVLDPSRATKAIQSVGKQTDDGRCWHECQPSQIQEGTLQTMPQLRVELEMCHHVLTCPEKGRVSVMMSSMCNVKI